jgi:hypothetical protein
MSKGEMGGMEEVALKVPFRGKARNDVGRAVESVSDNGMAERLRVHTDLVGTTGFDAHFNEAERAIRTCKALKNVNVGDGGAAVGTAGGHAGPADEIACDGEVDGNVVFFEMAVEEGEVDLGDLTTGEHIAELAVGAVVFSDKDEAAGELVEAVDDAWAKISPDIGEFGEME